VEVVRDETGSFPPLLGSAEEKIFLNEIDVINQ